MASSIVDRRDMSPDLSRKKELTEDEIQNLSFSQKDKNYIINYILENDIELGKKAILTHIFDIQKYNILEYMKDKKINYCFVHFSFSDGKMNPLFYIDDQENTYSEMFCAKFTHHADF